MISIQVIDNHSIPAVVVDRFKKEVKERYNTCLSDEVVEATADALKDFFMFGFLTEKPVGMPSILVDEMWHAYLMFTREYHQFCNEVGRFIHHAPEVDEKQYTDEELINKEGFRSLLRCYVYACEREELDPYTTDEEPLIFALDGFLPEENGKVFDIKWLQEKLQEIPLKQLM